MTFDMRVEELGISLVDVGEPAGTYKHAVDMGKFVWLSGHGSPSHLSYRGKVGRDVSIPTAQEIAEQVAISCLSTLKTHLGCLDAILRLVRITGYVNVDTECDFDITQVTDGASNMLMKIFGPNAGAHSRMSVGCATTPRQTPFAMDVVVETV